MIDSPTGIAHYITGRDWFIQQRRLESLARMLAGVAAFPERPKAEVPSSGVTREKPYLIAGATAVISIEGIITPEAWMYRRFGEAATDPWAVEAAFREAMNDAEIESILLAVNSPGGEVTGIKEIADLVYAGRAEKPVHAYIPDMACSSAFWIASQAQEISANAIARIGSIGAFMVLYDSSKAAEEAGVRVIVVRSGPDKGVAVRGAPISEEQVEPFQENVDDMSAIFVADIARGRGANTQAVASFATGRDWLAARALGLGLIDRVSTYDAALERIASVSAGGVE